MIGAVTAYLLFVKYGTVMMKERKPFDLKYFMHAYNLGLVLLSAYMSIEVSRNLLLQLSNIIHIYIYIHTIICCVNNILLNSCQVMLFCLQLFICAWSLNYNFLCDLIFYSRDKYSIRVCKPLCIRF